MNDNEPNEGDYLLSDCGPLGSRTGVCIVGGKRLGEFKEIDDALSAVLDDMERQQFWPNVFYVNDHGNTSLVPQSWFPARA